jgi:hypothetical protein
MLRARDVGACSPHYCVCPTTGTLKFYVPCFALGEQPVAMCATNFGQILHDVKYSFLRPAPPPDT